MRFTKYAVNHQIRNTQQYHKPILSKTTFAKYVKETYNKNLDVSHILKIQLYVENRLINIFKCVYENTKKAGRKTLQPNDFHGVKTISKDKS